MSVSKNIHCLGLMSGSSLDGLDIAHCIFSIENNEWKFEIKEAETFSYTSDWQKKLQQLSIHSGWELMLTNTAIAELWATFINEFIQKNKIDKLDFIASHGHTIFHEPTHKFSTQIGNGAVLAALTQQKIICDFRSTDVALGGQGAPLVPTGDKYLFHDYDAFLNLGGISNISIYQEEKLIAFDISPCNQWLNKIANSIGLAMDENGDIARSGIINHELLHQLNSISFYSIATPKSLSNKDCEDWWKLYLENSTLSVEDKLATVTYHIAQQIHSILPESNGTKKCLVTGGGAFNSYLMDLLNQHKNYSFLMPDKKLVSFKEALIFAFLGALRFQEMTNVFSSITGASKNSCSGAVYLP